LSLKLREGSLDLDAANDEERRSGPRRSGEPPPSGRLTPEPSLKGGAKVRGIDWPGEASRVCAATGEITSVPPTIAAAQAAINRPGSSAPKPNDTGPLRTQPTSFIIERIPVPTADAPYR